jgi:hypothetical protein
LQLEGALLASLGDATALQIIPEPDEIHLKASTAMIAPSVVKQCRRDFNGELRPNKSKIE